MKLPGTAGSDQIFAIGDIHGQANTLEKALAHIASTPSRGEKRRLILLGDLIDRGPENLRAIDLAMNAKELAQVDEVEYLWGNHELMFLAGMVKNDTGMQECWFLNGGQQLMIELEVMIGRPGDIAKNICDKMGAARMDFLKGMKSHTRSGDLLFVHAGISPTEPSHKFLKLDPFEHVPGGMHWSWIRGPFLEYRGNWDDDPNMVVVHGHTSANSGLKLDPDNCRERFDRVDTHRRINLDAGAAGMGQAMVLEVCGQDYDLTLIQEWDYEPQVEQAQELEP